MELSILFAQTMDSLSGGAGWVGAGLLGAVLCWLLLVHLPKKDKDTRELVQVHLESEAAQRTTHTLIEKEQRQEFRIVLDSMLSHNKEQVEGLADALKEDLQSLQKAVEVLRQTIEQRIK